VRRHGAPFRIALNLHLNEWLIAQCYIHHSPVRTERRLQSRVCGNLLPSEPRNPASYRNRRFAGSFDSDCRIAINFRVAENSGV
jgi:hypothetical protein